MVMGRSFFTDTRSTRVALDLGTHETIREEGQTSEGQQPHLSETSCHQGLSNASEMRQNLGIRACLG